ncbi:phosphoribosyltransferase domain-containing protein [Planotetraspora sp. A-T 1434]|uniref:phosphoribosyltransferase n=1 Tax=Planotetraspora sp. A-T 1434 TaxID=2979219 RepID=UPI0021C12B8A|nr:phosphoribosyltransferase domain-containing protein [Planotetraspora sp. A-T 1434]MCT9934934.1 phosphoribosyltransferase domain-containing protein [Planotetraspora sp. A-T 1434]
MSPARTGTEQRVFEQRRLWRMAPGGYRAATRLLAEAALERLGCVPLVIGIANGGRAPALTIAMELGASTEMITARHNPDDSVGLPATGEITCDLGTLSSRMPLRGSILLVDDICGSGGTLKAVIAALQVPENVICTATLCRNTGAPEGLPDLYVWDVADWVVFPWERLPHGRAFTPLPPPQEVRGA